MRTLVVSDLHLGARTRRDRLRDVAVRERLAAALHDMDRLVLLGDLVELRQGRQGPALTSAAGVLGELAGALPDGAEVLLVPGNHDHHLLSPWLERRAEHDAPLTISEEVGFVPGDPLGRLAVALAPARVRVVYPGVWLRGDIYALHGHYLDRHTTIPSFERLGAGLMARVLGDADDEPRSVEDYEAVLGPMYAWIHAVAQQDRRAAHGASASAWQALSVEGSSRRARLRRAGMRRGFRAAVALINRAGIGPVKGDVGGHELRRAPLRAIGEVVRRLEVDAAYVIFGHTHRAGPLVRDDPSEWTVDGRTRLLNTGSWIHEPGFLGPRPQTSPYRPGFAVAVGESGPPELVNLLDPAPG